MNISERKTDPVDFDIDEVNYYAYTHMCIQYILPSFLNNYYFFLFPYHKFDYIFRKYMEHLYLQINLL